MHKAVIACRAEISAPFFLMISKEVKEVENITFRRTFLSWGCTACVETPIGNRLKSLRRNMQKASMSSTPEWLIPCVHEGRRLHTCVLVAELIHTAKLQHNKRNDRGEIVKAALSHATNFVPSYRVHTVSSILLNFVESCCCYTSSW